jgi:SWI/SNF-related matrix-associated actin-dependent regulator of chromatin subfamily A3
MKEIWKHLGNAVSCLKYHGHGRERDLDKISQADIVLTTYKTLAADAASSTKNTLHKINWFRVVLDEGN